MPLGTRAKEKRIDDGKEETRWPRPTRWPRSTLPWTWAWTWSSSTCAAARASWSWLTPALHGQLPGGSELREALAHLSSRRFADVQLNVDVKHPGCEAALLAGLGARACSSGR